MGEIETMAATESDWPSSRLRWVLLGAFLALLALIFASGAAATRTLRAMHQQEQEARRALADRAQTLSKPYVSIEVYNQRHGPLRRLSRARNPTRKCAGSWTAKPPISPAA